MTDHRESNPRLAVNRPTANTPVPTVKAPAPTAKAPALTAKAPAPTVKEEVEVQRQMEIVRRGVVEILPEEELVRKLRRSVSSGEPLRLKLGMDPSAPDIHLGHAVVLQKLRQMQDMGHVVDLVIGDFTGLIGDPTGKSETRPQLSAQTLAKNARTYVDQVTKILRPELTCVRHNAEWLAPLQFADVIRLATSVTVARMLERDDFTKRFTEARPIHLHEFFYPLMQAYDSVVLRSDVEFGGTDQKFNLLMGRTLQKEYGQEEQQAVLMMPLLVGLDGVHKMSKSLGNYIGIDETPHDMYGKVMSVPDSLMATYFELLSASTLAELDALQRELATGVLHPRDAKMRLARELVSRFLGPDACAAAQRRWEAVFQQGIAPEDLPETAVGPGEHWVVRLLVDTALAASNSAARRAVEQGAVRVDNVRVEDVNAIVHVRDGTVLQLGKRQFIRCRTGETID